MTRNFKRCIGAAGLVLTLSAVPMAPAAAPNKGTDQDQAGAKSAIELVLAAQARAWNKGDLEGFMVGYWKSPELTFFSGKERTRGWDATLERYRKKYQAGPNKMGKLTFTELEIAVLGPDRAWVRGRWQVARDGETLSGLFTLILHRQTEGWRIVHDHTSGG